MQNDDSARAGCACGGRESFVLAPVSIIGYGRNGLFAQKMATCAVVPEPGFLSTPTLEEINAAELTMTVCTTCGACRFFADPAKVRKMLDAGEPGVSIATAPAAPPYR